MVKVIQKVNPFEPCLGRQFLSFPNIPKSPLKNLNVTALHKWLSANKKWMAQDVFAMSDEVDSEDNSDDGQENTEDNRTDSEEEGEI